MKELLISLIPQLLRVIATTREALAQDLREIADKISSGDLIPDKAFKKAKDDLEATKSVASKLPK